MKLQVEWCAAAALLTCAPALAAESAREIVVVGDLPRTGALGAKELEALGATTATWDDHGEKHEVTGVPLHRVLRAFGFEPGPKGKEVPPAEKEPGWRKVVLAVGRDGYRVAFSCAELWPELGSTEALVIWRIDGAPVPPRAGPFRLVVPTDRDPARAVRQLERLEVVQLARVPGRTPGARAPGAKGADNMQ
jgi:hypothetical protein